MLKKCSKTYYRSTGSHSVYTFVREGSTGIQWIMQDLNGYSLPIHPDNLQIATKDEIFNAFSKQKVPRKKIMVNAQTLSVGDLLMNEHPNSDSAIPNVVKSIQLRTEGSIRSIETAWITTGGTRYHPDYHFRSSDLEKLRFPEWEKFEYWMPRFQEKASTDMALAEALGASDPIVKTEGLMAQVRRINEEPQTKKGLIKIDVDTKLKYL